MPWPTQQLAQQPATPPDRGPNGRRHSRRRDGRCRSGAAGGAAAGNKSAADLVADAQEPQQGCGRSSNAPRPTLEAHDGRPAVHRRSRAAV
eukprot:13023063-Alexandrium_andersonii.AAC.1